MRLTELLPAPLHVAFDSSSILYSSKRAPGQLVVCRRLVQARGDLVPMSQGKQEEQSMTEVIGPFNPLKWWDAVDKGLIKPAAALPQLHLARFTLSIKAFRSTSAKPRSELVPPRRI